MSDKPRSIRISFKEDGDGFCILDQEELPQELKDKYLDESGSLTVEFDLGGKNCNVLPVVHQQLEPKKEREDGTGQQRKDKIPEHTADYEAVKYEMCNYIRSKLQEVEKAQGKSAKSRIAEELFDYLINRKVLEHPAFTRTPQFTLTVRAKLIEFHCDDKAEWATEKFKQLFHSDIEKSINQDGTVTWV